jgi:hypothetical protein
MELHESSVLVGRQAGTAGVHAAQRAIEVLAPKKETLAASTMK